MGRDGVDGGAKRVILLSDRLEDGVDMRAVGPGDFATMGIADEFPDDALEDAFLVGHQSGLECGQVAHLTAARKFHGGLNRDRGEFEFLCEGGSLQLGREFFHVAILAPLAPHRVVVFQGKTQGIDLRMTAGAAYQLLMLENGFADEYYDMFKRLVSDLRADLEAATLPVFILSNLSDQDLLKVALETMSEEDVRKAKKSASTPPATDADLLDVLVSYMSDLPKEKKLSGKNPYIATVIMAQNRAGREIPDVVSVHHGKLPVEQDGIHFNAEGQIQLGKITASAIAKFYKEKP